MRDLSRRSPLASLPYGPNRKEPEVGPDWRIVTEAASPDPLFALILEDRKEDFELVVHELRRAGFAGRCQRVETEKEYVSQLLVRPTIILADYVLPEFGALRALKLLQETELDVPFIVLTGAVSEELVVECMKRGAADYLLKDRLARLGPAVTSALEETRLRRQKKKTEAAFGKCSERFQRLVETTNVIPWEFDRETARFTYVGPQAVTLLGYPLEYWYGDGFWEAHVHPEDQDVLFRPSDPSSSKDHDLTCRMRTSDLKTIYLHCIIQTTTSCDNSASLASGFMVDITELKKTQQSLARHAEALASSNADLQQFAYAASHDLQEPLRMVSFYTQLLAKRYKGKLDSDADEFIGYALDGATRMRDLIKHLLEYSRVGARKIEFAPIDCEAIFKESMANLEIALHESNAIVTHDPLPMVTGDASQLGQVLQNLLGNAIKFRNGKTPYIHVSARQENEDWLFSVSDNGIGIEPQYLETIFAIFHQLHGKDKYEGTGVGLAMSRKIVERHRGRIWVESKPGEGATFYFTIPKQQGR
jgi:PAS domain S-box-containing protein